MGLRLKLACLVGLTAALLGIGPAPAAGVLEVASRLLDEAEISYVYGGYQVGDSDACKTCNTCLTEHQPKPARRLNVCPACRSCSLDCSHFTELVFREAGMPYPYLDTALMLRLSAAKLKANYGLIDLDLDLARAAPGDLLVYDGHVVLLEKRRAPVKGQAAFRGDIMHATGGKDIRRPGEGIQRERFIDLANFRGPLRRILRPRGLADLLNKEAIVKLEPVAAKPKPVRKLRPVTTAHPDE